MWVLFRKENDMIYRKTPNPDESSGLDHELSPFNDDSHGSLWQRVDSPVILAKKPWEVISMEEVKLLGMILEDTGAGS